MSVTVIVKGGGTVQLGTGDFLARGGEGEVYVKGGRAFKIYIDHKKMIPLGKMAELSLIQDADVIKPEHVLLDPKTNNAIGYDMRFVSNTTVLCQLFPKSFRDRNGITPDKTLLLVRNIQARMQSVHAANALMVDANEMNWLVGPDYTTAYAIDADSFQTKSFHATALMESIRDRHGVPNQFNEGTDWFAFAVVALQTFIGIHPYKGRYVSKMDMDERMLKNISVFDPKVDMPNAVLPWSVIPDVYRAWFKAVLQDGKRVAPPDSLHAVIQLVATAKAITGTGNFTVSDYLSLGGTVAAFLESSGQTCTVTGAGVFVGRIQRANTPTGPHAIAFTAKDNVPVLVWSEYGKLKIKNLDSGADIPLDLTVLDIMATDGRVYVRGTSKMLELVLNDGASYIVASTWSSGTTMEHASRVYSGCVIQSLLDATYVTVYPKSRMFPQLRMKELEGYVVTDAHFNGGVLMVVGSKKGVSDRFVFRFSTDYTTYDIQKMSNITPSGLNFITLDRGNGNRICINLNENEELEIFSCAKDAQGMKVVKDPALSSDMLLVPLQGGVGFARNGNIYKLSMK